jgi:hypothetical protein
MNCGSSPCGFLDFFPYTGLFTSQACSAWLSCEATGGTITPTPAQSGGGLLAIGSPSTSVDTTSGNPDTSACDPTDLGCLQTACASSGGSWDPVASACSPAGAIPTTSLIYLAIGVLLIGGFVLGARH